MSSWAIATPPTCAGGRLLVNIIIRHYYYSFELVSYHWCIITDAANVRRWPSCLLFLPVIITALDLIFIIKTDRTDCVCVCVCVCVSVCVCVYVTPAKPRQLCPPFFVSFPLLPPPCLVYACARGVRRCTNIHLDACPVTHSSQARTPLNHLTPGPGNAASNHLPLAAAPFPPHSLHLVRLN